MNLRLGYVNATVCLSVHDSKGHDFAKAPLWILNSENSYLSTVCLEHIVKTEWPRSDLL